MKNKIIFFLFIIGIFSLANNKNIFAVNYENKNSIGKKIIIVDSCTLLNQFVNTEKNMDTVRIFTNHLNLKNNLDSNNYDSILSDIEEEKLGVWEKYIQPTITILLTATISILLFTIRTIK